MTDKNRPGIDPELGNRDNPCSFMKLPRCMRQDQAKRLDLSICQACISGRMEGHLFAIKEKLVKGNGNGVPDISR